MAFDEKNYKIEGQWFLPDSPDKHVNGTLTFDTHGKQTGMPMVLWGGSCELWTACKCRLAKIPLKEAQRANTSNS
jgi:hypothetical protein